jgi:hypothetical protein
MSHLFPRTRVLGASLIGISALAISTVPGALAATAPVATPPGVTAPNPDPAPTTTTPSTTTADGATVLDTGRVLALAGDGANAAWLHADYGQNGGQPTKVTLWVRDAGGKAAQIQQPLPAHTRDLAIGNDAEGRTTIVLNAGGTSKSGPTTLYALPADCSARPKRLRASTPAGAEDSPGLLDGVLSFSRDERTRKNGVKHSTVRLGSLTSSRSKLVSDGKRGSGIDQTTPTAGGGVAYVTSRPDDVDAIYELRVLRPGQASKRLSRTAFGGASAAGFGTLVTTNGGKRLVGTRWEDGGGHPADRTIYAVPSGTRVGAVQKLQPGEQDLGVPVTGGFVYVDHDLPEKYDENGQLVFRPTS